MIRGQQAADTVQPESDEVVPGIGKLSCAGGGSPEDLLTSIAPSAWTCIHHPELLSFRALCNEWAMRSGHMPGA